jgi:pimeloyl-ACP methyl ester carboxylesterase
MRSEEVTFYSDGLELSGAFQFPDDFDPSAEHPLVLPCSGFTGLRRIHPERFARWLTDHGYACFSFDYRGFGDSAGMRRRVILEEQVRDLLHAVGYVEGDPRVDADRLILLGWGMGAGVVLDAARESLGVVGLIAVNGFYSGRRVQEAQHTTRGFLDFRDRVRAEYANRARSGEVHWDDPFSFYPLDDDSRRYVEEVLRSQPGYDVGDYSAELADSLLRWAPEVHAPRMRTPLLIAHGTRNALHPATEAESLFAAYGGPKELYWIEGVGHTEWMFDDDPHFRALGARIVRWLERLLAEP